MHFLRWAATAACLAASLPAQTTDHAITIRQAIEQIKQHSGAPWSGDTVDTIKAGNPDVPLTGIATAFAATYDVLERAVAAHANLIVAHEPTFYNHQDDTKSLTADPVYQAKLTYINQHGLVVFRFHDHWHRPSADGSGPDGILIGMVRALGWESYQSKTEPHRFVMPETTLAALSSSTKSRLHIRAERVIGDPHQKVRNIALIPGAAGEEAQLKALEDPSVDVLVAGEAREWETVEYVRDAAAEGSKKALILLGHVPSEEAGMDYCAEWLRGFLPGVPIKYTPSGEPFWTPSHPKLVH